MEKKIQIIDILGKVLFEYEKEKNTLKDTLNEANLTEANLTEANLYGADLRGANLRGADLCGANLREANLYRADLCEANLYGADLYRANLREADLYRADLCEANLYGANLREANLRGADLYGADLCGADLYGADLYGADLRGANLRGADLCGADLYGAYLNEDTKIDTESLAFAETRFLPEGDIIGYKKCRNNVIVKLLIPKEAKRSHAFGRKCRAEYAQVLEIFGAKIATSHHDNNFTYEVGDTVKPTTSFSEDWFNECESGIHFFITRIEAENY